jgi:drug/metabolite transporter (DMT)-like permease
MGIFYAFTALFAWGIGDFLIQRSARRFGTAAALFYVCLFFAFLPLPFVWRELLSIFFALGTGLWLLVATGLVNLLASALDFAALRIGKIAVVEPIYALEIIFTPIIGALFLSEALSASQLAAVLVMVTGVFLVSTKSFRHLRQIKFESGLLLALLAMLAMSSTNILIGLSARLTNPLVVNCFIGWLGVILLLAYFAINGEKDWPTMKNDWRTSWPLLVSVGLFDLLAWVAFAAGTRELSIGLVTAISEGYIALGAILGLAINKEKLARHQLLGLAIVAIAAIALSYLA